MKRLSLRVALCLVVLLLLPGRFAEAKGTPTRVVIAGPGLAAPLTVSDPVVLPFLGLAALENVAAPLGVAPRRLGGGYEITRYLGSAAFDRVRYYPARSGAGYVFYVGLVNGNSPYDGRWFPARPDSAFVLHRVLAVHGVHLAGTPQWAATPFHATPFDGEGLQRVPWITTQPASAGITGHLFTARHSATTGLGFLPTGEATILWRMTRPARGPLVIVGRDLSTGNDVVRYVVPRAAGSVADYRSGIWFYPAGLWRLTLTVHDAHGRAVTATATVMVAVQPQE